ncbi:Macro domain protein [Caballeronia terrestris]|uniref:Macro domain protein n=1 Tax=Caballeronia terrestris TaxID=1226301 RepID=A0A158KKV3_9BURK|nr:macro domain-containing protein [Caballeronia terrestris]SAL81756.1 Macro domain protein [Caballeronia terrestris]
MIEQVAVQDIFSSACQALVVPVNVVGTMGKGLAKAFALRYPGLEAAYWDACRRRVFSTRGLFVWEAENQKLIVCFPTKRHWRHPSRLTWIDQGLAQLARGYESDDIRSIAILMIGCGEGGLQCDDVYPLIVEWLEPLDLRVRICLSRVGG